MARTTLGDALDRLAEAAAEATELAAEEATRGGAVGRGPAPGPASRPAGAPVGPGRGAGAPGTVLADVVTDLEEAAGSSLGPTAADPDVVLLRRLDRARRLLLAARSGRAAALQPCGPAPVPC